MIFFQNVLGWPDHQMYILGFAAVLDQRLVWLQLLHGCHSWAGTERHDSLTAITCTLSKQNGGLGLKKVEQRKIYLVTLAISTYSDYKFRVIYYIISEVISMIFFYLLAAILIFLDCLNCHRYRWRRLVI